MKIHPFSLIGLTGNTQLDFIQAVLCYVFMAFETNGCLANPYAGANTYQHQQPAVKMPNYGYQYDTYSMPNYHQMHQSEEEEERPRIRLNFGVHVPAMKIQLPRFQLPKITIRAKIRQPERPSTISLPELNFDTAGKLSTRSGVTIGNSEHSAPNGYSYSERNQRKLHKTLLET